MNRIVNVWVCTVALAASVANAAPFLRIGSGPLNASVENERDAALDRAVAWLVASQSPEGYWGDSNVVATAVAALAIRGDREEMPKSDAEAVERAVKWLKSPACKDVCNDSSNILQGVTRKWRGSAWRDLALVVLRPKPSGHMPTNNICGLPRFGRRTTFKPFDDWLSTELTTGLSCLLEGDRLGVSPSTPGDDSANRFISATFAKVPSETALRPVAESLAAAWNDGTLDPVWLSNPEAGWWLARAINGATGGDLSLPPDADGRVRNVNWRGIMAGKWINSQRIDGAGNGHWDNDPEKTAFAVLLLNEM